MPEVSQWKLDHLEETEKEYYKLLKQWNQLKDALMPLLMEMVMYMKDTSEWVEAMNKGEGMWEDE